ncbi:hypothetical protein ETD86_25075 [Nonomuraea turkmeniaca]|uniref:Uncharacterized protein n=1 Tax=Nonomuraea turkmeniaca TaxID=103838 RepID=A0A5S4FDA5_9ACTN|nr:hypothetical protein [Nonomuraea turkmeniaca]TMR16484.1 hypothetical protein ETD86_25075 [Nonomuraea turkmeniaca]
MNDLEQRLRSALKARASTFEAGPDAWQRVLDRRPRRPRARWALAALPVMLLAVFVPVLLDGGLGRNSAADGADGIYRRLMEGRMPAGESVTLDDPAGGKLRLWFAKGEMGQPELCHIAERADVEPYGSCGGMMDMGITSWNGWFEGSTAKGGASRVMDYGVARPGVEAVGAVTKSGQRIPGTLLRPSGAPFLIWTVTYAALDPVSKVVFTEPGRADREMPRSMMIRGQLKGEEQAGTAIELAAGLTVGPYKTKNGRSLSWMRQGQPFARTMLERDDPLKDAPVSFFLAGDEAFGVARKDVAKVRITATGGGGTAVATRPDPWNLGLVLFATGPQAGVTAGYRLTAYDATGKEIWHKDWAPAARREPNYGKQIGDTLILPRTEDFGHGPVRLRFVKSQTEHMLCVSGGVDYDGRKAGGCGSAIFDDPNGFSHDTVNTFLPEPGTTISYGAARPEWEAVDAVLSDGRRIHGAFASAPGAPARVWYVRYPYGTEIAAHVFKVRGRQLEQVWHTRHDCWEATPSEGRAHALPRGITAALLEENCVRFWKGKKSLGGFEPIPGGTLKDLIAAERPLEWRQLNTDWHGFTLPGTARVEVALKGGGTATADTMPDPWGQGVVMFAGPVPEKAGKQGIMWPGLRFTGYDAAGRVVWTYKPHWPPY